MAQETAAEKRERTRKIQQVTVERVGEKLLIPEIMSLSEAKSAIERQMSYEEEVVRITEVIDAFPFDGAIAFQKAIAARFGWATAEPVMGWFGPTPPTLISVAVGYGRTVNVVWGKMTIPTIEGAVHTSETFKDGRMQFVIGAQVKRKHEEQIKQLADDTRLILRAASIYKGQAIRMKFEEPKMDMFGNAIDVPEPKFLDLSGVRENELVYSKAVMQALRTNVWAVIRNTERARKWGIPLKRGILMEGPYGTGKTLAAYVTAKIACDNGWSFVYIDTAAELAKAIRFGMQYGPCVIFCEDIDRAVAGGRSEEMDTILNTIDGIDSKNGEVMVVLTTNHVENINQAMLRPGRLDAVISVTPPDAEAAAELVRVYGRGMVDPNTDLTNVGRRLAGRIPAVIREVVEKSKLAVIDRLDGKDDANALVTAEDIEVSISSMDMHLKLLEVRPADTRTQFEMLGQGLGDAIGKRLEHMRVKQGLDLRALIPPTAESTNGVAAAHAE